MYIKKSLILLCTVVLFFGALTGCRRQAETNQLKGEGGKASIIVNGSTSVQPLAEELAGAFKIKNPKAEVDIQGGGSGVGIKSANDGVVDIGMSSRELKNEEKSLKEFKIAVDGIAVVVNPSNGINNLTMEQIMEIYTGKITDWEQLGGKQGKITVVSREEGSGTRGAFVELTKVEKKEGENKVDKTVASSITQGATGAVMTTIAGDPNAIGYTSYGTAKDNMEVKMISVDGKACTEENIYAGEYKISRPFLMLTKNEPAGLTEDFIDFVLSPEGQDVVTKYGYLKTID